MTSRIPGVLCDYLYAAPDSRRVNLIGVGVADVRPRSVAVPEGFSLEQIVGLPDWPVLVCNDTQAPLPKCPKGVVGTDGTVHDLFPVGLFAGIRSVLSPQCAAYREDAGTAIVTFAPPKASRVGLLLKKPVRIYFEVLRLPSGERTKHRAVYWPHRRDR